MASSSSVMPETYTGKNARQLGKENRTETQLFKKTRGTHRMPTEKTLRKKFSKTAEQARFSKLCKAGQQLSSLLQNFPCAEKKLRMTAYHSIKACCSCTLFVWSVSMRPKTLKGKPQENTKPIKRPEVNIKYLQKEACQKEL